MLHNEDPGSDHTYVFGRSELARYWTGMQYRGHRAAHYSLADVQYNGHRVAPYSDELSDEFVSLRADEMRGYIQPSRNPGYAEYDRVPGDDGISGYRSFGSGMSGNRAIPSHVVPYSVRGSTSADAWCSTPLFASSTPPGGAMNQLCALDNIYCAPTGSQSSCAAITALIKSQPQLFVHDSGLSDQIRIAAQCINGVWDGCCRGNLPCGTGGGGGGTCSPACSTTQYCGTDNQCHANPPATGGDNTTLLLVGGGVALALVAAFVLTQPR